MHAAPCVHTCSLVRGVYVRLRTLVCPLYAPWYVCDVRVLVSPLFRYLDLGGSPYGGTVPSTFRSDLSGLTCVPSFMSFIFLASCCCQVSGRAGIIDDVCPQGMCALMWCTACVMEWGGPFLFGLFLPLRRLGNLGYVRALCVGVVVCVCV